MVSCSAVSVKADWYRAWMAGMAPVVFWTAAFDRLDSKKP